MRLIPAVLAAAFSLTLAAGAQAQAPDAAKVQKGAQVFQYWCAACHSANTPGSRYPGTTALQAKYKGDRPAVLSERTDLTGDLVKFYVRNGISIMPQFRKTEVDDAELDAIGAYLTRNNKP